MSWILHSRDKFLKHVDKRVLIDKEGNPKSSMKQTKIGLSAIVYHSRIDGNGNATLLIDCKTKKVQNWYFCCKLDSNYVDYESNSRGR